jgi:hypothetical protein
MSQPITLAEVAETKLPGLTDYFSHLFWPGWQPEPDCTCDACKLEARISRYHAILEQQAATATSEQPESQVA